MLTAPRQSAIAATLFALISSASAADLPAPSLELQVGGTAYEGAPEFAVYADGVLVGEGVVGPAYDLEHREPIDPRKPARELLEAHSEYFYISLPSARPATVAIEFTNDHWGGEEAPQLDRNLFLLSVFLNGAPIDLNRFHLTSGSEFIEGGVISIYQGTRIVLTRETGEELDASR